MGEIVTSNIDEKYPEHAKVLARKAEHQNVQGFIDYLRDEVGVIGLVKNEHMEEPSHDGRVSFDYLDGRQAEALIAGYLEIDAREFEAEKQRMLLEVRRAY